MCTVFFLPKHLSAKFPLLLLEQRDLWGASSLRAEYLRRGRRMSRRPCAGGIWALEDWLSGWDEHSYSSVATKYKHSAVEMHCGLDGNKNCYNANLMGKKTRFSSDLRSAEVCALWASQEVSWGFVWRGQQALLFNIFQKQWLEHGPCGFLCRTAFLYTWEDSVIDLPFHIKVSQMQGRKQLIQ